jgi:hypothetical protein
MAPEGKGRRVRESEVLVSFVGMVFFLAFEPRGLCCFEYWLELLRRAVCVSDVEFFLDADR